MNTPARTLLAIAFPPSKGLRGALTRLCDLARPNYRTPLLFGRKEAAKLVLRANMEQAEASGHGNRAGRREAIAFAARCQAEVQRRMDDEAAELLSEGRIHVDQPSFYRHD